MAEGANIPHGVAESTRPDQARPDQARPDQARPDQPRPDQHRPNSRQRLLQVSTRIAELEEENQRLTSLSSQWVMYHAHAAHSLQRLREAVRAGETSSDALVAIIDDPDANAGAKEFVAQLVGRLATEWTEQPISELSRSAVRDWLLAHREAGLS